MGTVKPESLNKEAIETIFGMLMTEIISEDAFIVVAEAVGGDVPRAFGMFLKYATERLSSFPPPPFPRA